MDVICNINPEQAKSLESINYILNEFKVKFNSMNPAEQLLNRRFSGNSIILYTDETYTGAINIMKNANFVREDNSYINTIGNYIKKEDYINAYEYALKIKDRNI